MHTLIRDDIMGIQISFVVPIYKIDNDLLINCIESLINQSRDITDSEILLIDDGSTPDNAKICDEYSCRHPFIQTIHSKNMGVSVARNIGINNSKGKYICFVDPDDRLRKDYINYPLESIEKYNADIVAFPCISAKNEKNIDLGLDTKRKYNEGIQCSERELKLICSDIIGIQSDSYSTGACWGKLIRKQFLIDNNIQFVPGVKKAQDRIFMFDCFTQNPVVFFVNKIGYIYTDNNLTSICNKYNPNIVSILERTQKEFEKRINKYNKTYMEAFYVMNVNFVYEYMQLLFANDKNPSSLQDRKEQLIKLLNSEPYKMSFRKVKLKYFPHRKKRVVMIILFRMKMYNLALKLPLV